MTFHSILDHPNFQLEFLEISTVTTSRTASKTSKSTSRNPPSQYFLKWKYRKKIRKITQNDAVWTQNFVKMFRKTFYINPRRPCFSIINFDFFKGFSRRKSRFSHWNSFGDFRTFQNLKNRKNTYFSESPEHHYPMQNFLLYRSKVL